MEPEELVGRLAALEFLVTGLMFNQMQPQSSADVWAAKDSVFQSLQMGQRPVGEFEDAAWEQMVVSLEKVFANLASRADHNSR